MCSVLPALQDKAVLVANAPKQKGTGGETELLRLLNADGFEFTRTAPTLPYDLCRPGNIPSATVDALATRPDRGEWLVTVRLGDFMGLLRADDMFLHPHRRAVHVEVKRYNRFSLHTIFQGKFG